MATKFFAKGLKNFITSSLDWDTTVTVKAALLSTTVATSSNSFHNHEFWSDVSTFALGGQTSQSITPAALIQSTAESRYYLDCAAAVTFTGVTSAQTCQGACIYRDSGTAGTSELIAFLEFTGGTFATNGQDITINFNANGVGYIVY